MRQVGLGLFHGRIVRAWIDDEKEGALLDEVAFLNGDALQDPADLTFRRNRFVGFNVPDDLDIKGHGSLDYGGHGDRRRWRSRGRDGASTGTRVQQANT